MEGAPPSPPPQLEFFQILTLWHAQLLDKSTYSFETEVINIEYTDVGNEEVLCVLQKGNAAY